MPKDKLSITDRKILYYLDMDARISNSSLAQKVGLSKETVGYRIRRLEQTGIIKGYFTVIDASKLGYVSFRIYLKLQDLSPDSERELFDHLYSSPRVMWYVSVYGSWDLVIMVWVKDIFDFEDFWLDLVERFGTYIQKNWISILSATIVHQNRRYLLPDKQKISVGVEGSREIVELDSLDVKILRFISQNARCSLLDMQRGIGEGYKTIAYRLRQLENKRVILLYRLFLDTEKLGFKYFKVLFYLQNINRETLRRLEEFVSNIPYTLVIVKVIGGADFEVEIQCPGSDTLRQIIESIRQEFPGFIKNYEVLEYYDERKLSYLPPSL